LIPSAIPSTGRAGVPRPQAEANAEAARDFIMTELVTKTDLLAAVGNLKSEIENAKSSLASGSS
jgi:hypothetical protein